jgi:hypothetical protein
VRPPLNGSIVRQTSDESGNGGEASSSSGSERGAGRWRPLLCQPRSLPRVGKRRASDAGSRMAPGLVPSVRRLRGRLSRPLARRVLATSAAGAGCTECSRQTSNLSCRTGRCSSRTPHPSARGPAHAATPRTDARGSSRPWYVRKRPWRSLLNGRSLCGLTGDHPHELQPLR